MHRLVTTSAVALLLALPVSAHAADGLLETITVDPAATTLTQGKVTLKEGTRYSLEVTGTQSVVGKEGFGFRYDALWCYEGVGFDHPECSSPTRGDGEFMVAVGSDHPDAVDRFQSTAPHDRTRDLAYDPNHSYSMGFFPPQTGVLTAGGSDAWSQCKAAPHPCEDTVSGSFTIKIFGPASSGGGGTGGGGGGGGGGACDSSAFARVAKVCGTADLPFGTAAVLPAPAPGAATDISSGALPAGAKGVAVDVDFTDADVDRFIAILTFAKQQSFKRRSKLLNTLLGGCYFMTAGAATAVPGNLIVAAGGAIAVGCLEYIDRHHLLDARVRTSAAGCRNSVVPVWRSGSHPSKRARRLALAAFKATAATSCKARSGHGFTIKVAARGKTSIKTIVGKHATAVVERRPHAGKSDGPNPRMTVSWRRS